MKSARTIEPFVIGVDFDGTVVEYAWPPVVGAPIPGALETLRECVQLGARLILWTVRSGDSAAAAAHYLRSNGVELWGVNGPPWPVPRRGPKPHFDVLIDDMALGCPLEPSPSERGWRVNWTAVRPILLEMVTRACTARAKGRRES